MGHEVEGKWAVSAWRAQLEHYGFYDPTVWKTVRKMPNGAERVERREFTLDKAIDVYCTLRAVKNERGLNVIAVCKNWLS